MFSVLARSSALVACFIVFLAPAPVSAAEFTILDKIYFFLSSAQCPGGVVGGGIIDTSAQAFASVAFLNRGQTNRARRALDALDGAFSAQKKSGVFYGFAETYDPAGAPISERIDPFTQACVAAAAYKYRAATGEKKFDGILNALAASVLRRINAWGVLSSSAAFSRTPAVSAASENLCAYYILSAAAAGGDAAALRAAKRMKYALGDLFFDPVKKMYRKNPESSEFDRRDAVLARLFLGAEAAPAAVDASSGVKTLALSELAATPPSDREVCATQMFLRFPPDYPDGAVISAEPSSASPPAASSGATPFPGGQAGAYDIFSTAVLTFIIEGKNPFEIADEGFSRRLAGLNVARGEKWSADGFEGAESEFYKTGASAAKNAQIFAGLDDSIKKEGRFSLRFQFVPLKNEKSQAQFSRSFYPPQDFSSAGRIKFWLNARPATFTLGVTNLKIRLRTTDAEGVSADSAPLNYSGRGVENTVACPSGFIALGKAPNYAAIRELTWILEEENQISWNVNIDDVRVE